jgi:hypothetical protein
MRFAIAALACALLAGCYTSDKPLIGDADSVADYAKITFQGKDADSKPAAFTRDGTHYTTSSEGQTVNLNLKRIDGDYYVAQLAGPGSDGSAQLLYGYLHFDVGNKQAEAWRTFGGKDDVQPGLHLCKDAICIDDLAVYVAYAKKAVDAKAPPDTIFVLTVEQ